MLRSDDSASRAEAAIYPPTSAFGAIAADRVERELAAISDGAGPIALHVQVPRCDQPGDAAYAAQLIAEIARLARPLRGVAVAELGIGGSPNALPPASLQALLEVLEQRFAIAPGARRAIEVDPRCASRAQIRAQIDTLAGKTWILCIAAQESSEPEGAGNGAVYSAVIDCARAAGFEIDIEVAYGLPLHTEARVARTLASVIDLAPDRVALIDRGELPAAHDRLARAGLLLVAIDQLVDAGYAQIALDRFARAGAPPARERCAAMLGLGAAAVSSSSQLSWQNHGELAAWHRAIAAGALPVARGKALDADDRARRDVLDALSSRGEVDLGRVAAAHGLDAASHFAAELAALDDFAQFGELVDVDRDALTLRATLLGQLRVREICRVFDRYRGGAAGGGHDRSRRSPAI
jgi:oxygen-independent coproporphyrinogen-3 oxidase